MTAATQVREERLLVDNAKKGPDVELQTPSRFSANASKARQATRSARQIEKIKLEDVEPSSRANPFIRFEQDKKLYRLALEVKRLAKGLRRDAVVPRAQPDGRGRRAHRRDRPQRHRQDHVLRTLAGGFLAPDSGTVKWSENASVGYFAQTTPPISPTTCRCSTG